MPRPVSLVRPPSLAFHNALRRGDGTPDSRRALHQHRAYRDALSRFAEVWELPARPDLPDACFVEDVAVVIGHRVLLTRPGAPSRRAEVDALIPHLPPWAQITRMSSGTLDGGDVLRLGDTLFVGRSSRTDAAGIEELRRAFPDFEVRPVPFPEALHLKCHATAVGPQRIVLADGFLPPSLFSGKAEVILVPSVERYAANVLGFGDAALVAAGYPKTAEALGAAGIEVVPVPMDAFAAADGSLTCLSLLLDPPPLS